ncbi:MAG TPA: PIN domain nuclease [Solirubrobacteraceae bacterium]
MADTSAWVEFLRATGSGANLRLRALIEGDQLATTDVVLMEMLAGARDDGHRDRLRALLGRCEFVPIAGARDYEDAADVYRACHQAGHTVRALTDCLIASVAMRPGLSVLHADRDFDVIARHAPLEIA